MVARIVAAAEALAADPLAPESADAATWLQATAAAREGMS